MPDSFGLRGRCVQCSTSSRVLIVPLFALLTALLPCAPHPNVAGASSSSLPSASGLQREDSLRSLAGLPLQPIVGVIAGDVAHDIRQAVADMTSVLGDLPAFHR